MAVAPSHFRPHDRRVRAQKGLEDRSGRPGAHKRRVDEVDEHRIHAGPVRHRQSGQHRGELPLVAARVLDDSRVEAGGRDGGGHRLVFGPRHDHQVVDATVEERPADARHECVAADGQERFGPPHA